MWSCNSASRARSSATWTRISWDTARSRSSMRSMRAQPLELLRGFPDLAPHLRQQADDALVLGGDVGELGLGQIQLIRQARRPPAARQGVPADRPARAGCWRALPCLFDGIRGQAGSRGSPPTIIPPTVSRATSVTASRDRRRIKRCSTRISRCPVPSFVVRRAMLRAGFLPVTRPECTTPYYSNAPRLAGVTSVNRPRADAQRRLRASIRLARATSAPMSRTTLAK